jgi:hypothetical protein
MVRPSRFFAVVLSFAGRKQSWTGLNGARQWEVIVEPQTDEQVLVVVTAYAVD